jgi:hypothetical protein
MYPCAYHLVAILVIYGNLKKKLNKDEKGCSEHKPTQTLMQHFPKRSNKRKIEQQGRWIIFRHSTMGQGLDNNHHSFPQAKRVNHQWYFHFKKRSFTCVAHYTQDGPTNVRSGA